MSLRVSKAQPRLGLKYLGGPRLPPLCKVLRASDKQHRSFMVCVGHHAKVQLRPELGPCLSTFVYVTLSWAHGRILEYSDGLR